MDKLVLSEFKEFLFQLPYVTLCKQKFGVQSPDALHGPHPESEFNGIERFGDKIISSL